MYRTMLRTALVALLAAGLGGCIRLREAPPWGEPSAGAAVAAADCATCHADVSAVYAAGPHAAVHIACGQCHRGAGHPAFDVPLDDATCAGCHLPEYQQTLLSAHERTAVEVPGEVSEEALRGDEFRVKADGQWRFSTRDAGLPERGRLCVGCHFAGHQLSLAPVRAAGFCQDCHKDRIDHYVAEGGGKDNRCLPCHVVKDVTVAGQVVSSHAFGGESGGER